MQKYWLPDNRQQEERTVLEKFKQEEINLPANESKSATFFYFSAKFFWERVISSMLAGIINLLFPLIFGERKNDGMLKYNRSALDADGRISDDFRGSIT